MILAVGIGWLSLAAQPLCALPDPNDPVDPTKRAPISTRDAVRPAATPVKGNGVVGGRVIRMNEIPVRRSTVQGDRAAVEVRETRKKNRVIKPAARPTRTRQFAIRSAAERPAAIPRIDSERFRRILRDYEDNRVPTATLISNDTQRRDRPVSLADINRFANPRETLQAQGIPVTPAASGAAQESNTSTIPISRERNGGE